MSTLRCPIEFRGRFNKIHPRGRRRHPAARSSPTPSLAVWISGTRAKSLSPDRLPCESPRTPA